MSIELAPGRTGGLSLRHRVLIAAGGAGFGNELLQAVGEDVPGAIVTRSVTRTPGRGNPPPRMHPLPDGLLSSIGAQNPGLDAVLRRQGPRWAATDVPIIVSISSDNVDDIAYLARGLDMQPGVAGVELDLAGPGRGRGGRPIGIDVETSETATVAARGVTDLPLIVKLTPAAVDVRAVARAVAAAGADAICAIAPLPALALDDQRRDIRLGTTPAGLSGPSLKPVALRVVYEIAQAVRIPVIGCGGVSSLDDVLDFLAAGASAVGMATAALADPRLPARLGNELQDWCEAHGVDDQAKLVGTALPALDRGRRRSGRRRG